MNSLGDVEQDNTDSSSKRINLLSTYGKAGRLDGDTIQRKKAPVDTLQTGWLSYRDLDRCLCWLVMNTDNPATGSDMTHRVLMEFRSKQRGYQEQDRKRDWNPDDVLTESEIAERMLVQKQRCWHCNTRIHVLYRDRYDPLQWSIDRLDNQKGHTRDNVVVSCMRCNLRRGRTPIHRFKGTYTLVDKVNSFSSVNF